MGRTASPVAPGTNPTSTTTDDDATLGASTSQGSQATGEQLGASTADSAASTTDAAGEPTMGQLMDELRRLQARDAEREREMAAMRAQVNRVQEPARVEPLPKMADVLKRKPESPVLTEEGWYVPAVMPGSAGKN